MILIHFTKFQSTLEVLSVCYVRNPVPGTERKQILEEIDDSIDQELLETYFELEKLTFRPLSIIATTLNPRPVIHPQSSTRTKDFLPGIGLGESKSV